MFDVLMYLFETYYNPEACPDPDALVRKLSAAGFERDEIDEALDWLDVLLARMEDHVHKKTPQLRRLRSWG